MTRSFIAASVLVAAISAMGQAQQTTPGQAQRPQMSGEKQPMHDMQAAKTPADMKQACEKASQDMQAMKSECERADQQLDQQVQKIKQAQGEQKTEAMVQAITMMAEQRKQMQERSAQFMPKMMAHMQMHMAMAAQDPQQGRQAMSMCPMMQADTETARPAGQQLP